MNKLAEVNREKAIDLLSERLTSARAKVKLYDTTLAKMGSGDENIVHMIDKMKNIRDEEKEQEEWLEGQISVLGADPHGETEMSRVVQTEWEGIEKVVLDGDNVVPHLFHALLTAELADNAGWDLLAQLADDVGDHEAKSAFKKRLRQEDDHLVFVRKAVERFARMAVTGKKEKMPTGAGVVGRLLGH